MALSSTPPSNTTVKNRGSNTFSTKQQALATSAASVAAARPGRVSITLLNTEASGGIVVYYGTSGVTSSTGFRLAGGESKTIHTTAEVFMVAASGTPTVAVEEVYDE